MTQQEAIEAIASKLPEQPEAKLRALQRQSSAKHWLEHNDQR